MKAFRWQVIKCQRIVRKYLECRHARIYILSKVWDGIEESVGEKLEKVRRMLALFTLYRCPFVRSPAHTSPSSASRTGA